MPVTKIVRVEGLSELLAGLQELKKATATNIQKRALMKAGQVIEHAAEAKAPRLTGQLQRSFTTGQKLSREQRKLYKKESKVEVFVGPGALPQAITQEFGTIEHPPQPFMRPAWAEQQDTALKIIASQLAEELEKARQRAARKAAKLARGV